ncbi:unnamed protein product [Cuscuta europaea]|uniref:Uncharacterized protein n=1 Tax=Cuscuta europaea TaxID=41803 RepID=A0A9P0Z3D2_CUSEU|nr:unnamed protein product [Cuscuta europaea]
MLSAQHNYFINGIFVIFMKYIRFLLKPVSVSVSPSNFNSLPRTSIRWLCHFIQVYDLYLVVISSAVQEERASFVDDDFPSKTYRSIMDQVDDVDVVDVNSTVNSTPFLSTSFSSKQWIPACPPDCKPDVGQVWSKVRAWIGMPRQMTTLDSSVKWIKKDHAGAGVKAKAARIAFIYTIYWIWRVRNATRFDDAKAHEEEVFARIQYMVYKILFSIYPHELIMF